MLWLGWISAALAAPPELAVALAPSVSGADTRLELQGRLRIGGAQLGLTARGSELRAAWIDGWPVDDGRAGAVLAHAAVPLVDRGGFRFDLRAQVGPRWMVARATEAPTSSSLALLTAVGPRATLDLGDRAAVQLGVDQVTDLQLDPGFAMDGLGQLLQGAVVRAVGDDWQVALSAETGGLFGYDGDGAKYATRAGVSLRFVPGAAASWLWL
jgi:hypothetical protein